MSDFSRKHPAMAARLATLVESGLNPEEIIATFKRAESEANQQEEEIFPDEIMLISQPLAFRNIEYTDTMEVYELLRACYRAEIDGDESFRSGDSITLEAIHSLLENSLYKWILVEAPNGKGIETDGVILGVACFTTDGDSICNGVREGNLGSIRLFGILPRYYGFCIGQRLLKKVENAMENSNCCRAMVCIPSTRLSVQKWVENQNYFQVRSIPYPSESLCHTIKFDITIHLFQYLKKLSVKENDGAIEQGHLPPIWRKNQSNIVSQNEYDTYESVD
eukprot:gene16615-22703_t